MVSAVIVVRVASVYVAIVPYPFHFACRGRLSLIDFLYEPLVVLLAPSHRPCCADPECLEQDVFLACHDVDKVSQGLGDVLFSSDMYVDSAG